MLDNTRFSSQRRLTIFSNELLLNTQKKIWSVTNCYAKIDLQNIDYHNADNQNRLFAFCLNFLQLTN